MNPILYRYKDTESVIKVMDGYTPGEGWTPLYAAPQPERKHTEAEVQELMYHYVYAYDGQFEREARRILGVPKP